MNGVIRRTFQKRKTSSEGHTVAGADNRPNLGSRALSRSVPATATDTVNLTLDSPVEPHKVLLADPLYPHSHDYVSLYLSHYVPRHHQYHHECITSPVTVVRTSALLSSSNVVDFARVAASKYDFFTTFSLRQSSNHTHVYCLFLKYRIGGSLD